MKNLQKRYVPGKYREIELRPEEESAILEWSVRSQTYDIRRSPGSLPTTIQDPDLLTNPYLGFGAKTADTSLTTIQWVYGPKKLIDQLFEQPRRTLQERMEALLKTKHSIEFAIEQERKRNPHNGCISAMVNGELRHVENRIHALVEEGRQMLKVLAETMKEREFWQRTARDIEILLARGELQEEDAEEQIWTCLFKAEDCRTREQELFALYGDPEFICPHCKEQMIKKTLCTWNDKTSVYECSKCKATYTIEALEMLQN